MLTIELISSRYASLFKMARFSLLMMIVVITGVAVMQVSARGKGGKGGKGLRKSEYLFVLKYRKKLLVIHRIYFQIIYIFWIPLRLSLPSSKEIDLFTKECFKDLDRLALVTALV